MSTETETPTPETPETLFSKLEVLVARAKVDYDKLRDRKVQARATVFRKKMQELKALAQELRVEALQLRKVAKEAAVERKLAQAEAPTSS